MISPEHPPEEAFAAAIQYWHLEKLYIDLATTKGKGLTPLEKKFLQGLLCGYSPAEIAEKVYQSRSSSAVRVYLSNGIYKYIKDLIYEQTGKVVGITSWSRVTALLTNAGYSKNQSGLVSSYHIKDIEVQSNAQNWDERVEIPLFLGRDQELSQLNQWILCEHCHLVTIVGLGGLGKTTLGIKWIEQLQGDFDYIVWRSLRGAPTIDDLLKSILTVLSVENNLDLADSVEAKVVYLMSILRSRRCLLVFNQFEEVLASQTQTGSYRQGYQSYGHLLQSLAQEQHISCCLLLSREQPKEIALLQGKNQWVKSLCLSGLPTEDAQKLVVERGLLGSEREQQLLVNLYANNPLAIQIISLTIKNIFNGNITEFLETNTIIFSEIRELLDQHFYRLSDLEIKVMYTLAINQQLMELQGVCKEFPISLSPSEQVEILESLQRRSMLQINSYRFHQNSLLKAYILDKLVQQVDSEIKNKEISQMIKHILCETLVKYKNNTVAVA